MNQDPQFQFTGQTHFYRGKVRDVYSIGADLLVMVASNRISAFDVVLPKPIPNKGQVLNQIAEHFLVATQDIVPNWRIATPDPQVTIGYKAEPFKVEMVIRGYLAGHAARTYKNGERTLCGEQLPDGLKENDRLPSPIITPATKAEHGEHDEDISKAEILSRGIVSSEDYAMLESYTHALFERGTAMAKEQGLILVDTKYEFGKLSDGTIVLIDEIHTPDSSRYFYADGYEERQEQGVAQKQLSKEFVREWLMSHGFQGRAGDQLPEMNDDFVELVTKRYQELFEQITGKTFIPAEINGADERIFKNVQTFLANI